MAGLSLTGGKYVALTAGVAIWFLSLDTPNIAVTYLSIFVFVRKGVNLLKGYTLIKTNLMGKLTIFVLMS